MAKLGIDFGTSFTTMVVSTDDGKTFKPLRIKNCDEKIPTVMYYTEQGNFEFGKAAENLFESGIRNLKRNAKKENKKEIEEKLRNLHMRYITGLKRKIRDKNSSLTIPTTEGPKTCLVSDLITEFFKFLKLGALEAFFTPAGLQVKEVTVTYPVDFSEEQKNIITEAVRNAGFSNADFLEEPIAAAFCFLENYKKWKNIVVYDLGGGTFDLACVRQADNGEWHVPCTAGDKNCGGRDFDDAVYNYIQTQVRTAMDDDNFYLSKNPNTVDQEILWQCSTAKIHLSTSEEYSQSSPSLFRATQGIEEYIEISRNEFEELIGNRIEHTLTLTEQLLAKVKADGHSVDAVVLIGGSSAIPMIERRLKEKTNIPIFRTQEADTAVAQGAALRRPKIIKAVKVDEKNITPIVKVETPAPSWHPDSYKNAVGVCECKAPVFKDQLYCSYCGKILASIPGIEDKKMVSAIEERLKKLVVFSWQYALDPAYQWNETALRYASSMTRLKNMIENAEYKLKDSIPEHFFEHIDTLLEKCKNADFHIALVGTIKAGKSTLLNAMLGGNYASTSVTPETAVLTKFRSSDKGNYLKISYYTRAEWNEIWENVQSVKKESPDKVKNFCEEYEKLKADSVKNKYLGRLKEKFMYQSAADLQAAIHEYTSSKSAVHYFVKEVEVFLEGIPLPPQIVFVDTPGLDDVLEYRSNVTKRYIRRANAVLVCVFCKWLPGSALSTIFQVFDNIGGRPEKVYVLGTQTDVFHSPLQEWTLQHSEWTKYLSGTSGFNNKALAEKNIIGVSASLILQMLDKHDTANRKELIHFLEDKLKVSDTVTLTDEVLAHKVREFANIDFLKERIKTELVDKYSDLLLDDITQNYNLCYNEAVRILTEIRNHANEQIKLANSSVDELRRKYDESQKKLDEYSSQKKEVDKKIQEVLSAIHAVSSNFKI